MSFYRLPNPYNPGYAIPNYVMAEPPGRGVYTTKYIRRGTIDTLVPDFLSGLGSLGGDTLGALGQARGAPRRPAAPAALPATLPKPGFKGDPIAAYGLRVSEHIMRSIGEVDPGFRKVAMRAVLDQIDPSLWDRVSKKAEEFKQKGFSVKTAMTKALATTFSSGFAKEIARAGQTGTVPVRSQVGLALYGDEAVEAMACGMYEALGFSFSDIGSGLKKVGSAVVGGVKKGASAVYSGGKWVGKKAAAGAKTAYKWGKKALSAIGKLGCAVLNSPAAPIAAGAASAAYGVPPQAGAIGVEVAKGTLCKSGTPAATQAELMQEAPPPGAPAEKKKFPVVPVAIGAGALALLAFAR